MIRIDENTGKVPSEQLMSEMGNLIDEATKDGTLITTAGLRPTVEGVRVRLRNGKLATVDGPFTETKEVIGGFAIIEAKSKQEAIEMTMRFLMIHGDEWDIECEVRELDGPRLGATHRGFGHRPVRRNPHRAARRPRFGDFTGPEAVKSPTGQCRGRGPGISPGLRL
jgi:hypothetical protein